MGHRYNRLACSAVLVLGFAVAATLAGPRVAAQEPLASTTLPPSVASDPEVRTVVERMATYVSRYGETASFFVASEQYRQRFEDQSGRLLRPRTLNSEFALVRADGRVGWVGYRDVIEVDGRQVVDRKDRLESSLGGQQGSDGSDVARIVQESARFNIGPVSRNFNTPTTVLLFFHPSRIGRFTFSSRGSRSIDGQRVLQLDFIERARPTLMGKRDGTDVPGSGSVWVIPDDGTVVKTRIRLANFADNVKVNESVRRSAARGPRTSGSAPGGGTSRPAVPSTPPPQSGSGTPGTGGGSGTGSGTGGSGTTTNGSTATTTSGDTSGAEYSSRETSLDEFAGFEVEVVQSSADVEVTFRKDPRFDVWLPWKMSEQYQGAIPVGTRNPLIGKATGQAEYSNYRRFETTTSVVEPRPPR